jgi:hypothetical protein
MTVTGMKITPLLRYPHHYNLEQEVTASLCVTAAHYRRSTKFPNGPRIYRIEMKVIGHTEVKISYHAQISSTVSHFVKIDKAGFELRI